ncbi:MAG: hypothetical protein ABIJ57_08080 [Pseudomonadota bacterium]
MNEKTREGCIAILKAAIGEQLRQLEAVGDQYNRTLNQIIRDRVRLKELEAQDDSH